MCCKSLFVVSDSLILLVVFCAYRNSVHLCLEQGNMQTCSYSADEHNWANMAEYLLMKYRYPAWSVAIFSNACFYAVHCEIHNLACSQTTLY